MYALTIKKTGSSNYVPSSYYDKYIAFLTRCFGLITYTYELDSKRRLHLHGVVEKNPFKVLSEYHNEVHVKIKRIYDSESWLQYIRKDIHDKFDDELTLINNEVYHRYLFED